MSDTSRSSIIFIKYHNLGHTIKLSKSMSNLIPDLLSYHLTWISGIFRVKLSNSVMTPIVSLPTIAVCGGQWWIFLPVRLAFEKENKKKKISEDPNACNPD